MLMKNCCFCLLYLFLLSMETLGFTSVTTCVDEGNRYLQCVFGSWNTLLALQNELVFRRQILWFVPLFSRVWYACYWVLDTTCKFQCAGSFRAIFRYYLAKIAKLWSSYTCFKSLQTENQKNALYNLREAIAAHLSEDRVSLRDSVVEKTLTNHLVYYFAILLRKNL